MSEVELGNKEVEGKDKEVDQITKEFEPEAAKKTKKKDPKKVAAGKALAKRNKEAREAKEKMDEEAPKEGGMLSNIGIGTMIGISGLALGIGNLYLRWKEDQSRVGPVASKPKEPTEAEVLEKPEGKVEKIKRMEEENGL